MVSINHLWYIWKPTYVSERKELKLTTVLITGVNGVMEDSSPSIKVFLCDLFSFLYFYRKLCRGWHSLYHEQIN